VYLAVRLRAAALLTLCTALTVLGAALLLLADRLSGPAGAGAGWVWAAALLYGAGLSALYAGAVSLCQVGCQCRLPVLADTTSASVGCANGCTVHCTKAATRRTRRITIAH
jgi:hypothetical protein